MKKMKKVNNYFLDIGGEKLSTQFECSQINRNEMGCKCYQCKGYMLNNAEETRGLMGRPSEGKNLCMLQTKVSLLQQYNTFITYKQ